MKDKNTKKTQFASVHFTRLFSFQSLFVKPRTVFSTAECWFLEKRSDSLVGQILNDIFRETLGT